VAQSLSPSGCDKICVTYVVEAALDRLDRPLDRFGSAKLAVLKGSLILLV
jgi:hypothetical protein